VAGASRITEALEQEIGVGDGETSADMEFSLDSVACMGACSQAPVMRVDDETYGNLTADQTRKIVRELLASLGLQARDLAAAPTAAPAARAVSDMAETGQAPEGVKVGVSSGAGGRRRVAVCAGTACVFAGSLKIHDAFVAAIAEAGLADEVEVSIIGCHGLCSQGPLAVVSDGDVYYPRLKIKDVQTVVDQHLTGGEVVEKLLYLDPGSGERIACAHDIPFYKSQTRIALRDVGVINPERLDEYLGARRLRGARRALTTMTPEAIIDEILASACAAAAGPASPRPQVAVRTQVAGAGQVRDLQR